MWLQGKTAQELSHYRLLWKFKITMSHYNDEQQYIDNAASSVTFEKKNDLATIFDDFAVISDNFAAIFENFVMILHIQRWLYSDFAAIFYDF